MNVREMIAKLSTFDPELPIVVSGYEGGYDDPKEPALSIALTRDYEGGYSGKYDREYGESDPDSYLAKPWVTEDEKAAAFLVVAIQR